MHVRVVCVCCCVVFLCVNVYGVCKCVSGFLLYVCVWCV